VARSSRPAAPSGDRRYLATPLTEGSLEDQNQDILLRESKEDEEKYTVADQRFETRITKGLRDCLQVLSEIESRTRSDLVRRSLGLYDLARNAENDGCIIGFANLDQDSNEYRLAKAVSLRAPSSQDPLPALGSHPGLIDTRDGLLRYEMRISKSLLDRLSEIAEGEGISKADIFRRSLGFYSLTRKAEANGQALVFAKIDRAGKLVVVRAISLGSSPISVNHVATSEAKAVRGVQ
jgi:hypothetical protein